MKLPLDELIGLQKEVDSVVIDTKYIGMLKAKAIALDDAGCATRVTFTEAILIDKGIKYPYYHLVFRDNYTQWTYSINAINGNIIAKMKWHCLYPLRKQEPLRWQMPKSPDWKRLSLPRRS